MRAIKEARKLIEKNPGSEAAKTLSQLVLALKDDAPFAVSTIYQLDYDHFKLALEILQDWRIDRHYAKKLKLVDASLQAAGKSEAAAKPKTAKKAPAKPAAAAKPAAVPKKAAAKPVVAAAKKATAKPAPPANSKAATAKPATAATAKPKKG